MGGGTQTSLSRLVTALVKGKDLRSKTKLIEAERLGVPIVDESQMWSILREAERRRLAVKDGKHIMGRVGSGWRRKRIELLMSPRASKSNSSTRRSSSSSTSARRKKSADVPVLGLYERALARYK
jgi:hypothetical protein